MTRILRLAALTAALAAGTSLSIQAFTQHGAPQGPARRAETPAGSWNLQVESPHGTVPMTMQLKADGEKISGVIQSQRGDRAVTGTFKAGTLTMATTDDDSNVWNVNAKLAHGTLKGHISAPFGDMAFTAERGTAN